MSYIEKLAMVATIRLFRGENKEGEYVVCAQYGEDDRSFVERRSSTSAEDACKQLLEFILEGQK